VIPLILIGTLLVATLAVAFESAFTSASLKDQYKPLPRGMLAMGFILFSRLRAPQLATVRTTPSQAIRIAEASYGDGSGTRVTLVSLGGYVNRSDIVHDWIGTKTFIPKAVPSYVVRLHEPHPVALSPSDNRYWNVIVDAQSGGILGAFTYD